MTATPDDARVLLLTAWHLRSMRSMPRMFWRLRSLERLCRCQPGCLWVHRWISRRSLLLTSRWESEAAADGWLASEAFRAFDEAARALGGTEARVERARRA